VSRRRILSLSGLCALALLLTEGWVLGQAEKKLSAREIFYSQPTAQSSSAESSLARETVILHSNRSRGRTPLGTAEVEARDAESSNDAATPNGRGAAKAVSASNASNAGIPLGLRYSILKKDAFETRESEVDLNTIFHSGDKIRFRLDVNTSGYLYVINRGSSGNWNLLFPSQKFAKGDNRVQNGIQYEIPPGYVFTFDGQPGTEKIFIVFSRRPVPDLDQFVYDLAGGQNPKRPDNGRVLQAQVSIQDTLISQLRKTYLRDLIVEKVDETSVPIPSAPEKEKAVYVVNPSRSGDLCVVADIMLNHK